MTRLSTQLPLPNRVVLDRAPFIHPLLELLDEGGPAGVVLASRTEARLLEWRLGELTPLLELRAEVIAPRHERSGPVGSRPTSRFGTPTGAQRNAGARSQAIRFIERVAASAARLAHDRGWERVMISAGEHQTDSLVRALPPALRAAAVRDPRVLAWVDSGSLEELVTERLRAAHGEAERGLIPQVLEQAQGAGSAALGLSEVVGALNQARVAHLIYDPLIRYRGSVGHDRSLYADGETALSIGSIADERLTKRMVERALETGALVTPVEGAGSNDLAEASGIAAVTPLVTRNRPKCPADWYRKGSRNHRPSLRPAEPDRSVWLRATRTPTSRCDHDKWAPAPIRATSVGMHAGAKLSRSKGDEMRAVTKDWSARVRPRPRDGGRRAHPFSGRPRRRRLGPLEYMLLALIALGVAITIAMAVIDPSG